VPIFRGAHNNIDADIILISPRSTSLIAIKNYSRRRLYQALNVHEVKYVCPLYLSFAQWQDPDKPRYWRNIHIIDFDIRYPIIKLSQLVDHYRQLSYPDVVFLIQLCDQSTVQLWNG
jgi:putative ABC transport system permease protein